MRVLALLVITLLTMFPAIGLACGDLSPGDEEGTTPTTNQYEPNDSPETATPLEPGTAVQASIVRGGSGGDRDVYRCDVPQAGGLGRFRVVVESDRIQDLEMQVGASTPGAYEAITWPGWVARRGGRSIMVQGELTAGTVLVFISGTETVDYSVRVVWE